MTGAGPTRRAVLSALAVGSLPVLSACEDPTPAGPSVPAELRLRARVADEVRILVRQYAAAAERVPALREELATLAAEHQAHVEALLGPPAARRLLRSAATATATASPGTPPSPPAVAATAAQNRIDLAAAESAAAARRARQATTAPPGTARLLASIAACNAVHAMLLRSSR